MWFGLLCGWAGKVILRREVGSGLRGHNSVVVIAGGICRGGATADGGGRCLYGLAKLGMRHL